MLVLASQSEALPHRAYKRVRKYSFSLESREICRSGGGLALYRTHSASELAALESDGWFTSMDEYAQAYTRGNQTLVCDVLAKDCLMWHPLMVSPWRNPAQARAAMIMKCDMARWIRT